MAEYSTNLNSSFGNFSQSSGPTDRKFSFPGSFGLQHDNITNENTQINASSSYHQQYQHHQQQQQPYTSLNSPHRRAPYQQQQSQQQQPPPPLPPSSSQQQVHHRNGSFSSFAWADLPAVQLSERHGNDDSQDLASAASSIMDISPLNYFRSRGRRRRHQRRLAAANAKHHGNGRKRTDMFGTPYPTNSHNNSNHHPHNHHDDTNVLLLGDGPSKLLVVRARWLLLLLWLGGTMGVTYVAYRMVRQHQMFRYRQSFRHAAAHFQSHIDTSWQRTLELCRHIAEAYEHHGEGAGEMFPNVTLPGFEERFGAGSNNIAEQTDTTVSFLPYLATERSRQQWENYILEPTERVRQRQRRRRRVQQQEVQQSEMLADNPINSFLGRQALSESNNRTLQDGIWKYDGKLRVDEAGPPPYWPSWQTTDPSILLYNHYSDSIRRQGIATMQELVGRGTPVLTQSVFQHVDFNVDDLEKHMSPRGMLYYPIVNLTTNELSGAVHMDFNWHRLWNAESMPDFYFETDNGDDEYVDLWIILTNTCGQEYSFRAGNSAAVTSSSSSSSSSTTLTSNGDSNANDDSVSTIVFVSLGDLHTVDDESLAVSFTNNTVEGPCEYTTTIYPTAEFRADSLTTLPMMACIAVAGIFILTAILFGIYDRLVERRQSRILKAAIRTDAIVQSLFPANVRERMLKRQEEEEEMDLTRRKARRATATAAHAGGVDGTLFGASMMMLPTPKLRLKNYLSHTELEDDEMWQSQTSGRIGDIDVSQANDHVEPIADLFPHTTILFADIAGFTAWSSEREPSQVFKLLENLYRAFDKVANRLGVFKVETIGDCYVAVTGLPDPDKDHAVVMAKFAFECLYHMQELTKTLENALGPGTTDLTLRVGLHSGPVTAGVLRGEKSRFQLFGDTVNTAARMESTGQKNRIQVSQYTADLIRAGGKGHWLVKRDELVTAKGKGEMQTYWLRPASKTLSDRTNFSKMQRRNSPGLSPVNNLMDHPSSESSRPPPVTQVKNGHSNLLQESAPSNTSKKQKHQPPSRQGSGSTQWAEASVNGYTNNAFSRNGNDRVGSMISVSFSKKARLVNWNVDILMSILTKVVAHRRRVTAAAAKKNKLTELRSERVGMESMHDSSSVATPFMILDEVTEIIELPEFDPKVVGRSDGVAVLLPERIKRLLKDYVTRLASTYHDNPFHNFEHASHVTMSANKLFKRMLHSDDIQYDQPGDKYNRMKSVAKELHYSTYGISSDPLIHFAIVFSALIHDADHSGVPNAQLVKEESPLAKRFNNKSCAEQNSLDIAWDMLMEPRYHELRQTIWGSDIERRRFRQLLVNAVMATDIMDKQQQIIRKKRWEKAFRDNFADADDSVELNRKGTAVLEHIIQASDVAHTMQHWRIYCKWNERLFHEMYVAWKEGRAAKDPTKGWYEGEIWFFDNYIIPLAKKLKGCGVFGVSSYEYLQYAVENRREWEVKGRDVVAEMLNNIKARYEGQQENIQLTN